MTSQITPLAAPPTRLLEGAALFLDFDGTLVPIADRPDEVRVDARLRALLARLVRSTGGRVAVVSGRSLAEVGALIGTPLTIAGSHGVELAWADGRVRVPDRPEALARITRAAQALRSRYPEVLVEEKPFGVALHYRQAPEAEAACRSLATALSKTTGFVLQAGKMVFEIRHAAGDKGDAIAAFMAEPPMAGTRPIFLGDDLTDEPAFEKAADMGGAGILIGALRPTAARYRLANVGEALDWLERAAESRR